MINLKTISEFNPAKRLLLIALDELVKTKHINELKTRDIYDYAGISANTFYYHFKDKFDCALLLVKVYEVQLHQEYTGSIEDFFDYISSGEHIRANYSKQKASSNYALDLLRLGFESEYDKVEPALSFWRENVHIYKNILTSTEQNSPKWELDNAWLTAYKNLLKEIYWLTPMEQEYYSVMLFNNFDMLWNTCIPSNQYSHDELMQLLKLHRKVFFSIFNLISENETVS